VRGESAQATDTAHRARTLAASAVLDGDLRYLRDLLIALSRALRLGRTAHLAALARPAGGVAAAADRGKAGAATDAAAKSSARSDDLIEQMIERVERIRSMLLAQEARWNIERHAATPRDDIGVSV
jgi:hypothetical protein